MTASQIPDTGTGSRAGLETTASLLLKVKKGDPSAQERLVQRYLPALTRWAHGRLPRGARDLVDTEDIVQVTLIRAFNRVMEFEPKRTGAFWAYLRRILLNEIRDQARRNARAPDDDTLPEGFPHPAPSPLEEAIGIETLEKYESALDQLTGNQREAVLMRVELGFSHREIAEALGSPSPNAARMLVARGIQRLAEVMDGNR